MILLFVAAYTITSLCRYFANQRNIAKKSIRRPLNIQHYRKNLCI